MEVLRTNFLSDQVQILVKLHQTHLFLIVKRREPCSLLLSYIFEESLLWLPNWYQHIPEVPIILCLIEELLHVVSLHGSQPEGLCWFYILIECVKSLLELVVQHPLLGTLLHIDYNEESIC